MKVKLKGDRSLHDLTNGNIYRVIGIEADNFRLMNDHGRPYVFPHELFDVIDESRPDDWQIEIGDDGETYAYPPALNEAGFFEDVFDGNACAISTLYAYLNDSSRAQQSA